MIRVTRSAIIDAPIERVWPILRDFNSHWAWHPAVGESVIENDEPSDQVGCVRNFNLKDGNHIREQLLALSDDDHISTYCILDATLPMRRYVATLQLKRVTDGNRTFWHWQSTFDVPAGREKEFEQLVGGGVYEGGFEGLRTYLRTHARDPRPIPPRPPRASVNAVGSGSTTSTSPSRGAGAMAAQGVVATAFGGPDVLRYQGLQAPAPGPGEVRIQQRAIGVNYIDVYVRRGLYRMITPPAPLGMEASGVVIDVGEGVSHLLPGDRVAYACAPVGAYVSVRTMPADQVVVRPDGIDDETAAALMLKGMSAHYLLHRAYPLRSGDTMLVHAAAGGLGQLLCQWGRSLGARVIGTVSTDEKARIARANGCDTTIVTRNYEFARAVQAATGGRGAQVIYDGLGREAMAENIEALALCGHWVSYGQASGPMEAIAMETLSSKSITLTRPVLFHYTAQRPALQQIATQTFEALQRGVIRIDVQHRYPLASAAQAHRDLEARATTGPLVLLP